MKMVRLSLLSDTISRIKKIGYTDELDGYAARRLGIFNTLNFIGLLTGIIIPLIAILNKGYLPVIAWIVAAAPAFISLVVLIANYYRRYNFAMLWYFILYPAITSLVYMDSIDVGIELFFILYAVFGVFFLQQLRLILLAISFSLISYFAVFVVEQNYEFVMRDINYSFYVFNHVLSVALIFIGLFLIKKENKDYQAEILNSNEELYRYTQEIEKQKEELAELNNLKSKLFSVISHDLRTPLYGLRNLFKSVEQYDLPAEEIKVLIPDVVKDLHYTTDLMENLLQWAKSQMKGESLSPQLIDMNKLIHDVQQVVRLQAENKQVYLKTKADKPVYIYADKEMIEVVLRNLISNAIKFTPKEGEVVIDVKEEDELIEVLVRDTGTGMSEEAKNKLFGDEHFTTKGTSNESGTGLGLMICKEFLKKNGGDIHVESELGKGSTFAFTLPRA
ncbi:ATP-binding protein [Lacibacter sediminis]|uniref:histidine kinase n=1 Tax=Lacibacter sediminis TaxID=2760713 RepID=A0A7G5XBN1_9BACT|nr:ATP-binding protein [Lacibacter sediminis]QNA42884.1 GHKL domain-containing protein [Lacibacter sediminis]